MFGMPVGPFRLSKYVTAWFMIYVFTYFSSAVVVYFSE